jgi:hypothetical protein
MQSFWIIEYSPRGPYSNEWGLWEREPVPYALEQAIATKKRLVSEYCHLFEFRVVEYRRVM